MAKSARKRTKRKPARRKSRAGKAAGHPRRKARPASRKVARRKSRKASKRKAVKHAPATNDTSWPVILIVMIVLLTGLIAAWQFGGATMAANAAAYMPLPAAEILLLNDYGCENALSAETWLIVAHPGLVPSVW
jgi:hypothetical protein